MHKGCVGFFACLALILGVTGEITVSESETKTVGVDGFRQLKRALESSGECVVYLKKNIELTKEIRVKGVKVLQGKGRKIYQGKNHRGNLLYVKKATLSLEEVTVEGNKKASLRDKSAVHAGEGSMVLCKKGTIRNHSNLRGGAAVMVDAGGVFEMQGGILEKNTCGRRNAGQKNSGCGGAVVNKGKFVLTRGTVKNNRAFGVQSERRGIGGAGGGIYNEGHCYIQSGDVVNNQAMNAGGGIYTGKKGCIWIRGGRIKKNQARLGADIYGYHTSLNGEENGELGQIYDPDLSEKKSSHPKGEKEKKPHRKEMPAVTDTPVPEKSRESGETKVQETKKERPEPGKKQEALWQVTIQREAGENRDKKKIVFVTPSKEAGGCAEAWHFSKEEVVRIHRQIRQSERFDFGGGMEMLDEFAVGGENHK